MRNANTPSGPGKPEKDALDKVTQREGIQETLGDEEHSASSSDRQPNLQRPHHPVEPSTPPGTRH